MRKPEYMSPTSLQTFYRDRREYYLQYLADTKLPRLQQTLPMAVGSAFDAYIKSYMHQELFGHTGDDNEFDLNTIFEAQVEPQHRDKVKSDGAYIFEMYKSYGALIGLMELLIAAKRQPRFEQTVQDRLDYSNIIDGIPILGKPDLFFGSLTDILLIILDWKVNGYCNASNQSPKPGYIKLYPGGAIHKKATTGVTDNIIHDTQTPLELIDEGWATQTSMYGWVLGIPVGEQFIGAIDQIVAGPNNGKTKPDIRIASFRNFISKDFQHGLFKKIAHAWECIQSGHIFDDLSRDESDEKCAELDSFAAMAGDEQDAGLSWYYTTVCRGHRNF